MTFEEKVIKETVQKLIRGEDYRMEVVNSINALFMDYMTDFFQLVIEAKSVNSENWYKDYFFDSNEFDSTEIAIHAGLNRKTVTNVFGTANKETMYDASIENFNYLNDLIQSLNLELSGKLDISTTLSGGKGDVILNLVETFLIINTLTTKKAAIRGGAWSSIGKKVEKPLLDELCRLAKVPSKNIDNSTFRKDQSLSFDREVDYKLIGSNGEIFRIEVKLMGRGNPESADAFIARDSRIFIADTLSDQNKAQLTSRGVEFVELKDNTHSLSDFIKILKKLDIPHSGF